MSSLCKTVKSSEYFFFALLHLSNDINQSVIDRSGQCVWIMFVSMTMIFPTFSGSLDFVKAFYDEILFRTTFKEFKQKDEKRHTLLSLLKNMSNYRQSSSGLCNTEKQKTLILPMIVSFTVISPC